MAANQENMGSAANLQERAPVVEPNNTVYVRLISRDMIYVVLSNQFSRRLINMALSIVGWTGIIVVCFLLMLGDLMDTGVFSDGLVNPSLFVPMVGACIVMASQLALILLNRKILNNIQIFTVLNATIYLILATLLYGLSKNYQWVLGLIFGIFQIIIGLIFLQKKTRIIYLALFSIQPLYIGLKVDGNINQLSWVTVMLLPIVMTVCLLILASLHILNGVQSQCTQQRVDFNAVGLIYKGLAMIGLALCFSVIWARVCFLSVSYPIAFSCIFYYLLFLVLYIYPFRIQILLAQAKGQMIASVPVEVPIQIEKIEQQKIFYKLSSNWLTLNKQDLRDHVNNPSEIEERASDCAVCLAEPAAMVWMPCGHYSVCEGCGKYLMDHSKLACIICKTKCHQIYHIVLPPENQHQFKSNFHYLIK